MRARARFLPLAGAVLAAALTCTLYDVVETWAAGFRPPAAYLLRFGIVTPTVALLVALAARLTRRSVAGALSLWAGICSAFVLAQGLALDLVLGVAIGIACRLWLRRRSGLGAIASGLVIGWALALTLVEWNAASFARGPVGAASYLVVFTALLLLMSAYLRLRGRAPRLPSLPVACALVLAAVLGGKTLLGLWPDRSTAPVAARPAPAAPGSSPPTILVLVLDTVRADHLSLYGYERVTDPHLRGFVERDERVRVYPLAFSSSSWTLPAHASLFTGTLASDHGAHALSWRAFFDATAPRAELKADVTLAEHARRHGYRTIGLFANPVLITFAGLERGFDVYEVVPPRFRPLRMIGEKFRRAVMPSTMAWVASPTAGADGVNRAVLRALDGCGEAPCFVVANYMDAHTPLAPLPESEGVFAENTKPGYAPLGANIWMSPDDLRYAAGRYDETILDLDRALGALLEELAAKGVLDRSWLVITSDHGEGFGEHGVVRHGSSVYNEQSRIPLIMRPPSGETLPPATDAVSLIDVTATLAAVAGGGAIGRGRDLRSLGARAQPVGIEYFGLPRGGMDGPSDPREFGALADVPARAVVLGSAKLVDYGDRAELYDLTEDPREQVDRAEDRPAEVERLFRLLPPLEVEGAP